jgi:hypothetical protein
MAPHRPTASGADTHDRAKATPETTSPSRNRRRAAATTAGGGRRPRSRSVRVIQANRAAKARAVATSTPPYRAAAVRGGGAAVAQVLGQDGGGNGISPAHHSRCR